MKNSLFSKSCVAIIIAALSVGCGSISIGPSPTPPPPATQTAYPTHTAYPTFTPVPPTPTPTRAPTPQVGDVIENPKWRVQVVKAQTAQEFGSFFIREGGENRLVIVTIEYTNRQPNSIEFFPESVLMVYVGTGGLRGWVRRPALYRSELSSQITNFDEQAQFNSMPGGATRTDTFVYEWKKPYTDFLLFFPETEPIAIKLQGAE